MTASSDDAGGVDVSAFFAVIAPVTVRVLGVVDVLDASGSAASSAVDRLPDVDVSVLAEVSPPLDDTVVFGDS